MIGADVVDIERLRAALRREPELSARLFTPAERRYCSARSDPARSFAGTLAAKEAVMKAFGLASLPAWCRRIEIVREPDGSPLAKIEGITRGTHVSISHDGGVALAVAIRGPVGAP